MRALIVIAKAPLPGFAKTRLVDSRSWGAERVARLADAFLRDTLSACRRVAPDRLFISFAPPECADYFRALDPRAALVPQPDGDLGERMRAAFEAAFAAGATRAVIVGCDAPHLGSEVIDQSFERLERAACVIVPTADGGYALLGLRERVEGLFEGVEWSTPRVCGQTERRARELGVVVEKLGQTFDVDGPEELERLRELLARDPGRCPETWRVLEEG